MRTFGGYVRVSRVGDRAETLISPQLQRDRIEGWARARSVRVVMLAPELDESGGRDDRPILLEAIEAVERGELDGIVVPQLDRLSRSTRGAMNILERIEAAGGEVHSVAEPLDAATPEGRMTRSMLFSIATMERERHQAGFKRAKADAVRRGIHVGKVPYGYVKGPDRSMVPEPVAAAHVREVFKRRAAGQGWRPITDWLTKARGRGITERGIVTMVRSRVYLGEVGVAEERNLAAHQPLVTVSEWEAAQITFPRTARGNNGPALLARIIRCAGCGYAMSPGIGRGGRRNYRCKPRQAAGYCQASAHISALMVEPVVEATVLAHVAHLSVSASERTTALREAATALATAEHELAAYRDEPLIASTLGAVGFAEGLRPRVEAVDEARRALTVARVSGGVPDYGEVADGWPTFTVEQKRAVIGATLSVVWVRRGQGAGRVRIVRAGVTVPRGPFDWRADVEGEVRVPRLEDSL